MEKEIIRFDMEADPVHNEPMTEKELEYHKKRVYTEMESDKFNEERKEAFLAMTDQEMIENWDPYPVPQWVWDMRAEAKKK